ncbi:MAG: hypothetical protein JSU86_14790 [Phycisphaerales bacterium]|nr:MAG: hypothetical protein JSU86_14790 [Phycisphaerales bacterium]
MNTPNSYARCCISSRHNQGSLFQQRSRATGTWRVTEPVTPGGSERRLRTVVLLTVSAMLAQQPGVALADNGKSPSSLASQPAGNLVAEGGGDGIDEGSGSQWEVYAGVVAAATCFPSSMPEPDRLPLPGNPINQTMRYLSLSAGDPGRIQAVRVTFNDVPPPYDSWNGLVMWVAQPETFCQSAGQVTAPCAGAHLPSNEFSGATLQCDPLFKDWASEGVVHVFHEGIIPSATYTVQVIDSTCAVAESDFSAPLIMTTSRWGDVVRNCMTCPCGPPDGVVGIPTDVTAVLDKFKNLEPPTIPCYAIMKVRADFDWETPNQRVDISDVTFCLDAFRGVHWPVAFGLPSQRPCSP